MDAGVAELLGHRRCLLHGGRGVPSPVARRRRRPHLTFILDLSPLEGLARARARGKLAGGAGAPADPFEGRDPAFHEHLRKGYAAIAKAEPRRCTLVDAAKPTDVIAAQLWTLVEQRLLSGAC